jgi:hypothetical protein
MGSLRPHTSIIYESPDGGETVYGRYPGESERFLVGESLKAMERRTGLIEGQLWKDIQKEAKNNPALHDAIERVKMIYYLSKKDGT